MSAWPRKREKDDADRRCFLPSYVLITPARNEEAFIEKTIESMIQQTVLPRKWVIVDDGSTDKTPDIVSRYLEQYPWIEMVQRPQRRDAQLCSQGAGIQCWL